MDLLMKKYLFMIFWKLKNKGKIVKMSWKILFQLGKISREEIHGFIYEIIFIFIFCA